MSTVTITFRPARVALFVLSSALMIMGLLLTFSGAHFGQWWCGGLLCGLAYAPFMFGLLYNKVHA